MQQGHQAGIAGEQRLKLRRQPLDQHAVLRHGEGMLAFGLAVPARDAGKAMGDVFDLDVQRRRIQQVEPAAAEHSLPSAGLFRHVGLLNTDATALRRPE